MTLSSQIWKKHELIENSTISRSRILTQNNLITFVDSKWVNMLVSFDTKISPICRMLKKQMEWQGTDNYVIRMIPLWRLTMYFLRSNSILFRGNNDEVACGSEKLLVSLPWEDWCLVRKISIENPRTAMIPRIWIVGCCMSIATKKKEKKNVIAIVKMKQWKFHERRINTHSE